MPVNRQSISTGTSKIVPIVYNKEAYAMQSRPDYINMAIAASWAKNKLGAFESNLVDPECNNH
jgi:hypothetical protein